jgi:hypothetical protein
MVSWVLFIFCTGLSVPSFGQTVASTEPASEALPLSSVSGIVALVGAIQPKFDALDTQLQIVSNQLDKTSRRIRQTRQYSVYLLAVNSLVVLLIALVFTGVIGKFPLISRSDWETLQTFRTIHKRQEQLKAVVSELKTYMIQARESRDDVSNALSSASKSLIKTE